MLGRIALALWLSLAPSHVLAAPEALQPYPEDAAEQLEFLARCAGLVRAMTFARIDIDHYKPLVPDAFAAKSNQFSTVIRPRTMELFGFDPADLTVLDENRKQMYHAFVVSSGVDQAIERGAGFYETMSRFRERSPEWGQIIVQDLETCAAAEFE